MTKCWLRPESATSLPIGTIHQRRYSSTSLWIRRIPIRTGNLFSSSIEVGFTKDHLPIGSRTGYLSTALSVRQYCPIFSTRQKIRGKQTGCQIASGDAVNAAQRSFRRRKSGAREAFANYFSSSGWAVLPERFDLPLFGRIFIGSQRWGFLKKVCSGRLAYWSPVVQVD